MTIYRIQDRDGRGPWKPGFSLRWTEDRTPAEYDLIPPPPIATMLSMDPPPSGYGCETIAELKHWFRPTEYRLLLTLGYRAVHLEADTIIWRGVNQVAFRRRDPLKRNAKRFPLYPPT